MAGRPDDEASSSWYGFFSPGSLFCLCWSSTVFVSHGVIIFSRDSKVYPERERISSQYVYLLLLLFFFGPLSAAVSRGCARVVFLLVCN